MNRTEDISVQKKGGGWWRLLKQGPCLTAGRNRRDHTDTTRQFIRTQELGSSYESTAR